MQFLYRLKFGCAVVMISLVCAVGYAADGDLAPIQTPIHQPVYNAQEDAIEVDITADRATIAGTTSCELLGDPVNQAFQGSSRYRGNVISIEQKTTVVSIEMELTISVLTTLQFTVHERQINGTFKLVASKTKNNVIGDLFHSSGLLTSLENPGENVILQAGKTYAFGVTWNTNVNYYIGGPLLPTTFATGEILGWISRNSVVPPIGDLPNLGINDSPGSGTYSMRICLPPATGACCRPKADGTGGECRDVFEDECFAPGSTFHGQRTKCSETLCEFGACCFACNNECLPIYTPLACRDDGGEFHWPGLDCSDISLCEPVAGACCVGETCVPDLCERDCLDPFIGGGTGIFHGPGTDCEPGVCVGACCKDDTCEDNTESACLDLIEGVFHGIETTCKTLDPSVGCGTGACCFTNEAGNPDCDIVTSRSECSEEAQGLVDAVYRGDGTNCNIPCPESAPISGCCLPNGVCINTTQTFCETAWVGGTFNSTQLCEDPTFTCSGGSCCLTDGRCKMTTANGCPLFDGIFTGNPSCGTNTCSGETVLQGACCGTSTGDCQLLTKVDCERQHRTFIGGDCSDPSGTCPGSGGCCTPLIEGDNGYFCVDDVSVARCGVIDGTPLGDGSDCAIDSGACDQRSACCTPRGVCRMLLAEDCAYLEGVFHDGEDCGVDTCISGACCLGGGDCEVRIWEACQDVSETYQGDDTTCGGDACDVGSCCRGDGQCVDGLLISECNIAGGANYDQTLTCAELDPPCSPIGACCLGALSCEPMRQPDCETAGGVYQGDFACGAEVCIPGVCCLSDLSCVDAAYATTCETQSGGTFIDRAYCIDRPCDPTGACCLNGNCSTNNQFDCELEGGTYFGDDTVCDANLCKLGACCQLNGVCNDGVLSATCTGIDAVFRTDRTCSQFCIARGACCLDGACSVTTKLQCENAGGNYDSDGSVCRDRDNLCTVGACCMPSGTNTCNEFTELDCIQSDGIYQGPASDCTAIREAQGCQRGSCCHLDGSCVENTVISECLEPSTFSGEQSCGAAGCQARGACCNNDTCEILTSLICLGSGGEYTDNGIDCTPEACLNCRPVFINTIPSNCATDPRYPHDPFDTNARLGWDEIVIEFDCDPSSLLPSDFTITGPDAPTVVSVLNEGSPNTYRLILSTPIGAGNWTEIKYNLSEATMNIGSLPGDSNNDGTSNAVDVTTLIGYINGNISPFEVWQCDIDHSGECGPSDILALINLLNGAELFDPWMDATIPTCPTLPPP